MKEKKRMSKALKITLIILTILIIGPLVFVGTCLPLGAVGFAFTSYTSSNIIVGIASVIGLIIAIFVVVKIIKHL